jgi:hypothetical protein
MLKEKNQSQLFLLYGKRFGGTYKNVPFGMNDLT